MHNMCTPGLYVHTETVHCLGWPSFCSPLFILQIDSSGSTLSLDCSCWLPAGLEEHDCDHVEWSSWSTGAVSGTSGGADTWNTSRHNRQQGICMHQFNAFTKYLSNVCIIHSIVIAYS